MNLVNEMSRNKHQDSPVDLEYQEIVDIQNRLSADRGYKVCFWEAKCYHTLDKIDGQVEDINATLRQARFAEEQNDDQYDDMKQSGDL